MSSSDRRSPRLEVHRRAPGARPREAATRPIPTVPRAAWLGRPFRGAPLGAPGRPAGRHAILTAIAAVQKPPARRSDRRRCACACSGCLTPRACRCRSPPRAAAPDSTCGRRSPRTGCSLPGERRAGAHRPGARDRRRLRGPGTAAQRSRAAPRPGVPNSPGTIDSDYRGEVAGDPDQPGRRAGDRSAAATASRSWSSRRWRGSSGKRPRRWRRAPAAGADSDRPAISVPA